MRPAVVVGGRTQALALVRALGPAGVPVVMLRYDHGDFAHGSRWVRQVVRGPCPEHDPGRFVQTLAELADRWPGALLMPSTDIAVGAVSASREELTQLGFQIAAPDPEVVLTCLDKSASHEFARSHGVAAPETRVVGGVEDLECFAAEVGLPGVLKPKVSHRFQAVFGRKWTRVDTLDEAVTHYKAAQSAGFEVVLQELIPGDELHGANYNGYLYDDGAAVEMTGAKIRNSPAETGSPSVVISRHIPEVADAGRRLLTALGYRGFANIEFKRDPRDGQYKLIEINARHNMSAMLAIRCGINFPLLEYRHRTYGEVPTQPEYAEGVHWVDVLRDLRVCRDYLRREDYSVRRFLRPYASRPVFGVPSRRDPRPAAIQGALALGMLGRATVTRASAQRR